MPVHAEIACKAAARGDVARRPLKKETYASQFSLDGQPYYAWVIWGEVLALPSHNGRVTGVMHNCCYWISIQVIKADNLNGGIDGALPVPPDDHLPVWKFHPTIDVNFAFARGCGKIHWL